MIFHAKPHACHMYIDHKLIVRCLYKRIPIRMNLGSISMYRSSVYENGVFHLVGLCACAWVVRRKVLYIETHLRLTFEVKTIDIISSPIKHKVIVIYVYIF